MKIFAEQFYGFSSAINRIALKLAAFCILGMLLVMMLQVVARYLFSSPPFWTEELARWLMVWGGLLGASCAFHQHADPSMVHPPADSAIRQKIQVVMRFVASWVFFVPVLYYCWPFILRQLSRTSDGLHVSTVWMNAALPVAIILILMHGLAGLGALLSPTISEQESSYAQQTEENLTE